MDRKKNNKGLRCILVYTNIHSWTLCSCLNAEIWRFWPSYQHSLIPYWVQTPLSNAGHPNFGLTSQLKNWVCSQSEIKTIFQVLELYKFVAITFVMVLNKRRKLIWSIKLSRRFKSWAYCWRFSVQELRIWAKFRKPLPGVESVSTIESEPSRTWSKLKVAAIEVLLLTKIAVQNSVCCVH